MEINPKVHRKIKKIWKSSSKGQARDRLAGRQRLAAIIARHAESGQVAVVYGGIDCDGGRWDDSVIVIPAQVMALVHWENAYYSDVEGPQCHHLEKPSEVADLEPENRDLALEAFENGHPHVINY